MDKIVSFTIDHEKLLPGLYVSRVDKVGAEVVTTFDMRVTTPNKEPVMDTGAIHTIEHLMATYIRNDREWADKLIYFGPMGCRTGFYMIFAGERTPLDIKNLLDRVMDYVINFSDVIPGVSPKECGNYNDHNLDEARYYARKYRDEVLADIKEKRYVYPE
jgi:S-ribosylhomocysteine lyase